MKFMILESLSSSSTSQTFTEQIGKELSDISKKLIPNLFSFVVQLLALVVVIVVVMLLLYKPVKKTLVARNDYIEKQILEAKENNVLSEQNRKQAEQEIIDARKKSSEIIESANKMAELQKAQIIEDAHESARKMKLNAEEEIQKAKQEAIDDVHDEIVNVALEASKELLKREINEDDSSEFVKDFLKEVK